MGERARESPKAKEQAKERARAKESPKERVKEEAKGKARAKEEVRERAKARERARRAKARASLDDSLTLAEVSSPSFPKNPTHTPPYQILDYIGSNANAAVRHKLGP